MMLTNLQPFVMTDEQLALVVEASKPVPYMVIAGQLPESQQDRANRAWQTVARALGCCWDTIEPAGRDPHYFRAVPLPKPEGKTDAERTT